MLQEEKSQTSKYQLFADASWFDMLLYTTSQMFWGKWLLKIQFVPNQE